MHFVHNGNSSDLSGRGYKMGSNGERALFHHLCTEIGMLGGMDLEAPSLPEQARWTWGM